MAVYSERKANMEVTGSMKALIEILFNCVCRYHGIAVCCQASEHQREANGGVNSESFNAGQFGGTKRGSGHAGSNCDMLRLGIPILKNSLAFV